MEFDHVGIITTEKKPGEVFVEATRVWITNLEAHPYRVEWLRFEPDSPVTGPLREMPHIGYRVQSVEAIHEASKGLKVLLEPFDAGMLHRYVVARNVDVRGSGTADYERSVFEGIGAA